MDAVEYIKTLSRMCNIYRHCEGCPIRDGKERSCGIIAVEAESFVDTVEAVNKWGKEHPVVTRQSVFLERYPNAKTDEDGNIGICPAAIEGKNCNECSDGASCCKECRSNYWSQEVQDDDD